MMVDDTITLTPIQRRFIFAAIELKEHIVDFDDEDFVTDWGMDKEEFKKEIEDIKDKMGYY